MPLKISFVLEPKPVPQYFIIYFISYQIKTEKTIKVSSLLVEIFTTIEQYTYTYIDIIKT